MLEVIRVTKMTRTGALLAMLAGGLFIAGTAVADDVALSDETDAWGAVSVDDLGETRGGAATAQINADIHQEFNGDVEAGSMSIDEGVIESSMSINAFNTGNNVVMLNTLAIDICMDCTEVSD